MESQDDGLLYPNAKENIEHSNGNNVEASTDSMVRRRLNPMQLKRRRRMAKKLRLTESSSQMNINASSNFADKTSTVSQNNVVSDSTAYGGTTTTRTGLVHHDKESTIDIEEEEPEEKEDQFIEEEANEAQERKANWMDQLDKIYSTNRTSTVMINPDQPNPQLTSQRSSVLQFLRTGSKLPFDWSLKSKLEIITNFSCRELWTKNMYIHSKVLKCPPPRTLLMDKALRTELELAGSWEQSLKQWQVMNLKTSDILWKRAFRSAYYTLRYQGPNYFYAVGANAVAAFYFQTRTELLSQYFPSAAEDQASHDTNEPELVGILSRSNHTIRSWFEREGIPFDIPFDTRKKNHEHSIMKDLTEEDLKLILPNISASASTARTSDSSSLLNAESSVLVFQGHEGVHGLFEYLLNIDQLSKSNLLTKSQDFDLLAPFAFENAELKIVKPHIIEGIQHQHKHQLKHDTVHRLNFHDWVLPTTVMNLAQVIIDMIETQDIENAAFSVFCTTPRSTQRFNGRGSKRYINEITWTKNEGYIITTKE